MATAPTVTFPINNDTTVVLATNTTGPVTVFQTAKMEGGTFELEVGTVERRARGETTQETAKVFERWSGSISYVPATADGWPIFEQLGALLHLTIDNPNMTPTEQFSGWVRITNVREDGSDVNGFPIITVDWVNHGEDGPPAMVKPASSTKPA